MLATAALVAGAGFTAPALAQLPGVIIDRNKQPGVGAAMQQGMALPGEPFDPSQPLPGETAVPRDRGDIISPGDIIEFASDTISFDDNSGIVTAAGKVDAQPRRLAAVGRQGGVQPPYRRRHRHRPCRRHRSAGQPVLRRRDRADRFAAQRRHPEHPAGAQRWRPHRGGGGRAQRPHHQPETRRLQPLRCRR